MSTQSSASSVRSGTPSRLSTDVASSEDSQASPPVAPYAYNNPNLFRIPTLPTAPPIALHHVTEGVAALHESATASSSSGRSSPAQSDPAALAEELYNACNNNDKAKAVEVVCKLPPELVAKVAAAFETRYQKKAHRYIKERIGGADRHLVLLLEACAAGPFEFDANLLHEALHQRTVHYDVVVEILAGRPEDEIREIRVAYKRNFNVELDVDIFNQLSSPFKDLMLMIIEVAMGRRWPGPFDVQADVKALYDAGAGRPGKEDLTIFRILVDRPVEHVRDVALEYQSVYGKRLEDDIRSEYLACTNSRRALKLCVRSAISRVDAVAHMCEKALRVRKLNDFVDIAVNGSGADDHRLVRLVVEHRRVEVRNAIKRAFLATYRKSISSRIKEVVKSADYQSALMVCLGEH